MLPDVKRFGAGLSSVANRSMVKRTRNWWPNWKETSRRSDTWNG